MTKANEQTTAEAVRLISKPIDDHWTGIEGIDDLMPALVASVTTALAARDAAHEVTTLELQDRETEVSRLKYYLERAGWRRCDIAACNCNGYHNWNPSKQEIEEPLREQNQKQRALLGELKMWLAWCGSHARMGIVRGDGVAMQFLQDIAKWSEEKSANPAVVELLKSVWVPTVQCNGAMACVTIPNRVTTLKFDTESECQTWCDKRNETDALWVPVEHKELLRGVGE